MIKQILEKNDIQTGLMIDVDGIKVSYYRILDRFAYCFIVSIGKYHICNSEEDAKNAIMKAIEKLETQSYDHGSCWRRTEVKEDNSRVERYGEFEMTVDFRIRDSY